MPVVPAWVPPAGRLRRRRRPRRADLVRRAAEIDRYFGVALVGAAAADVDAHQRVVVPPAGQADVGRLPVNFPLERLEFVSSVVRFPVNPS